MCTQQPTATHRLLAAVLALGASSATLAQGQIVGWGRSASGQTSPGFPESVLPLFEVATGGVHNIAVLSDGTVRCWGAGLTNTGVDPEYGQSLVPPEVTRAIACAAGNRHSAVLLADGSVRCWGRNNLGQCSVPADLPPAVRVIAGWDATRVILADGTLRGWGANSFGEVTTPSTLGPVLEADGGENHAVALRTDGQVRCWGLNGSDGRCTIPPEAAIAAHVGAGRWHSIAVLPNGTVRCWGNNIYGQCNVPAGLPPAVKARGGAGHTAALLADGTVRCWGAGDDFVGDLDFGQSIVPPALGPVVRLEVGSLKTIALTQSGNLAVWGDNRYGSGAVPRDEFAFERLDAGLEHTVAILGDGSVSCLGSNRYGQATPPATALAAVDVAAGEYHSVAAYADGSVRCWGAGTTSTGAGNIQWGQSIVPPDLGFTVDVSAGFNHTMARLADGSVRCWGRNNGGQLNVPANLGTAVAIAAGSDFSFAITSTSQIRFWGGTPFALQTPPAALTTPVRIEVGQAHAVALDAQGVVHCWGENTYGQLNRPTGVPPAVGIAAGQWHSAAVYADGSVRCWGSNNELQSATPADLGPARAIAAGTWHTVALLTADASSCGNPGGAGAATVRSNACNWQNIGTWSWSSGSAQVPGAQSAVDLGPAGVVAIDCGSRAGTFTARSGSTLIVPLDLSDPTSTDHEIVVAGAATLAGRVWLVGSGASVLPANLDVPVISSSAFTGAFDIIQSNIPAPAGKFLTLVPTASFTGTVTYSLKLLDLPGEASLTGDEGDVAAFTGRAVAAETMDVNDDGFDDLAIALDFGAAVPGSVQVLLNDGTGALGAESLTRQVPAQPTSIATGDANSDGRDDLVVGVASDSTARLFLGAGPQNNSTLNPSTVCAVSGTPLSVNIMPASAETPTIPDALIVGSSGSTNAVVLFASSTGTPTQSTPVQPAPATISRRGRIVATGGSVTTSVDEFMGSSSLVVENGAVAILRPGAGDIYAVSQTIPIPGKPALMDFADIDGDGLGDIVTANNAPQALGAGVPLPVVTLLRAGATGFGAPIPIAPTGANRGLDVTLLDADLDGVLDLVSVFGTVGTQSKAALIPIDAPPASPSSPNPPLTIGASVEITATTPKFSARGDLDGIGGEDLYLVDGGAAATLKQLGAGLARPFLGVVPRVPPCTGDIDLDGDVDGADLASLLNAWATDAADADLDQNGVVNGADLAALLNAWGPCVQ